MLSARLTSRCWILSMAALLLLALPLPLIAATLPKLAAPPEGERWFSVTMGDERVGFAHLTIAKSADGYRIDSESGAHLQSMMFSRQSASKQTFLVGPDLALKSFSAENRLDGKPVTVTGEVGPKGLRTVVESRGETKERTVKLKAALYPPDALNIYPLLRGAVVGRSYKVQMLDPESGTVKQVKIKVVGQEALAGGVETVHLRNNLYPIVDNDIWVDLSGNTVRESVRDDLIVTTAEEPAAARQRLVDDALAQRDPLIDFSLVAIEPPIARPGELKKLTVELTGIPASMPVLQGKGQLARRQPDGAVAFTMPNSGFTLQAGGPPTTAADLEATPRIPAAAPEIIARKNEALGTEKEPAKQAKLLVEWVAREVKVGSQDRTALEALAKRDGSSQSHARLYAALARAAGIPTKVVSGLVYVPEKGFLYHSWVESYLADGWLPLDPTYGEYPANVTHIKLVEGDAPDATGALANVIGRLKGKVIEKAY